MAVAESYDVVVLGGGPGGYTAAFRCADLGLSVCLVERSSHLGGVCLRAGCIPSKTLLHAAGVIEEVEGVKEYGVAFQEPKVDIEQLREKKKSIVEQLAAGLDGLCRARNITRVSGYGKLQDSSTLLVSRSVGNIDEQHALRFNNLIVATGSRPSVLPFIDEDPRVWDSSAALELRMIPKRFLIIGGGVIGLEMAEIYSGLGSEITIVEMEKQIIPQADKDLVQPLFLKLKKKYNILTGTRVKEMAPVEEGIKAVFEHKKVGEAQDGLYDAVLVAVGRQPNSEGMGFEEVGLEIDERGFLQVNEKQQTNVPNIYGVGDVVGEPMLAHKATHEAKVAAEIIAGQNPGITSKSIPAVAYTSPEVAWIGLTEKEAKAKGLRFTKGKFPWGASGRALSAGVSGGVTKALFDAENGRIIGAGICGQNGGELIHEAALALELGATAEDISRTVHAHPTLAETFGFAAEIVDGSVTDVLPPRKKR